MPRPTAEYDCLACLFFVAHRRSRSNSLSARDARACLHFGTRLNRTTSRARLSSDRRVFHRPPACRCAPARALERFRLCWAALLSQFDFAGPLARVAFRLLALEEFA